MHEPKQKYWSDKDLCAPKLFFFNESNYTCRQIKILLFRYVFALIKFPQEIQDKLNALQEEQKVEAAYKIAFEDSSYGLEKLYKLKLLKKKAYYSSYSASDERDFLEDDKTFKDFLGENTYRFKLLMVSNGDIDFSELHVKVKSEAEEQKRVVSLDDCI